jgi:hypothetical protein
MARSGGIRRGAAWQDWAGADGRSNEVCPGTARFGRRGVTKLGCVWLDVAGRAPLELDGPAQARLG